MPLAWTPDGESIVEHVAGIEDYQVAHARLIAELIRCFILGAGGVRKQAGA